MNRFLCLILLTASTAWAQFSPGPAWLSALPAASSGSTTVIFQEGFEGSGYENGTWGIYNGTANPDYTAAPLVGSQSLYLGANVGIYTPINGVAVGLTNHVYVQIRFSGTPSGTSDLLYFYNNLSTIKVAALKMTMGGVATFAGSNHDIDSFATFDLTGKTNHVWLQYAAAPGVNNGELGACTSVTGVKPAVSARNDLSATSLLGNLYLYVYPADGVTFDKLEVWNVPQGDNGN